MPVRKGVSQPALVAIVSVLTLWLVAGCTTSQEKGVGLVAGQNYSVEERAVNFEFAVEGEPPTDAMFFAQGPLIGLPVRLADPDGDGIYTGATTVRVTVNPDGTTQPAPIAIFGGVGTNPAGTGPGSKFPGYASLVVKDFGPTVIEDGRTLRAGVSFSTAPDSGNVPTGQEAGEETVDDPAGPATLEQAATDGQPRGEADREQAKTEGGLLDGVVESIRGFAEAVVDTFESLFSFLSELFG